MPNTNDTVASYETTNPRRDNLILLWRICCKRGVAKKHKEKSHIGSMDGFMIDGDFLYVMQVGKTMTIHFGTLVEEVSEEDFMAMLEFYNNCDQDHFFERKMGSYLMNFKD